MIAFMMRNTLSAKFYCILLGLAFGAGLPMAALAQASVWVQIDTTSRQSTYEDRIAAFSQALENTHGFLTATGDYAIAIGPFAQDAAETRLAAGLQDGTLPDGSIITRSGYYVTPLFPETPTPIRGERADALLDETQDQARDSESELDRDARAELQIALQWFGFYNFGIDGALGRGSRAAMAAWQEDQGYDPTGILTTRQRAELVGDYNQALASINMQLIRDETAGIEIELPTAWVAFDSYNYPFANYSSINDSGVQVFLISQQGERPRLFALYEIMQTLNIVPPEGDRSLNRDSFVLTGQSDTIRSHTEVRLQDGTLKGFTIIWPPERDADIGRVLPMMQSSITAIEGVLQPQQSTATAVPTVLDVRQPDQVFTGFFINAQGAVLTTHDVTQNCTTIRIADMHPVDLAYSDETAGFAVLQPQDTLSPIRFAEISAQPPAISTSTMIAGFPFNGTLGSASTIMGEASREQGGQGQANLLRLDIETRPGESGGPVIAQSGAVIGMILPQDHNGRTLPANVTLAQSMATIADALQNADITLTQSDEAAMLSQRNMARLASEITVPLACYN